MDVGLQEPTYRPASLDELKARAVAAGSRTAANLARPAMRLVPRPITLDSLPVGASRIGGCPDVSPAFCWPTLERRPMTFLAQLNLQEAGLADLPAAGQLLFFADSWNSFQHMVDAPEAVCVLYLQVAQSLERHPHPCVERRPEDWAVDPGPFACCAVDFESTFCLPHGEEYDLPAAEMTPAMEALYDSLDSVPSHLLLGHSQNDQGAMRVCCESAAQGLSNRYDKALFALASRWRLLLQLDSDDKPGFCWGDAGKLFFWIDQASLRAGDFAHVRCEMQC